MKKFIRFTLILWLAHNSSCLTAQRTETVYRSDSKKDNYYLALLPESKPVGLLVILPGFGTAPDAVLKETKLPEVACKAGYVVVIPLLFDYFTPDTARIFEQRLHSLIPELLKKYQVPSSRFMIGGHSLGGNQALCYAAESCMPGDTIRPVRPALVFGVDPPLDMKRLYNNYVRVIRRDPAKAAGSEAEFIVNRFNLVYGGPPESHAQAYQTASGFYRDAPDGGNAGYLKDMPVRLYSDPDIDWYLRERDTPIEWTNTADLTACIAELRRVGNKQAAYISCLGKGYLPDGRRHPHAFSMVDAEAFMVWVRSVLE